MRPTFFLCCTNDVVFVTTWLTFQLNLYMISAQDHNDLHRSGLYGLHRIMNENQIRIEH